MNMRPIALIGGAMLSVASFASTDAKQEITRLHRQFAQQLVAKDYGALEEFFKSRLAKGFTFVRATGEVQTARQMLRSNRQDMQAKMAGRADGPTRYVPRIQSMSVSGNKATVVVRTEIVGEWLKDGRRMPVVASQLVRESWIRQAGVWKALRFDELSTKGTVDGKPVRQTGTTSRRPVPSAS